MLLAFAIEAVGILLQAKYGQDPIAFLALFVPKPMREAHAKKYMHANATAPVGYRAVPEDLTSRACRRGSARSMRRGNRDMIEGEG